MRDCVHCTSMLTNRLRYTLALCAWFELEQSRLCVPCVQSICASRYRSMRPT
jgi:hypothetical protein